MLCSQRDIESRELGLKMPSRTMANALNHCGGLAASEVNGGIPAAVLLIQSGEMTVQDQAQHEMMVAWDPEYSAGFLAAQKHQDDAALKAMEASAEAMRNEALLLESGGTQARNASSTI